ncbi:MAG TPA: hypothetical protein VGI75_04485, partial [Pirellulales bacterium]
KTKSSGIMPNPDDPDCEGLPSSTMHDLQNTTLQPAPFRLHSSSFRSMDSTDGCVESIPGAATPAIGVKTPKLDEGDIREAMRGGGPLLEPVGDVLETTRE